jgi:hypothetical protein
MKWAAMTAQARSEEDFELLTRMLEALGFGSREVEEYRDLRLKPFFPQASVWKWCTARNREFIQIWISQSPIPILR